MGGDDLGSDDDDYLNITDLPTPADDVSDDEYSPEIPAVEEEEDEPSDKKSKKRKGASLDESDDDAAATTSKKSKRKTLDLEALSSGAHPKGRQNFLLDAGRDIVNQSSEIQAAFLWTCYRHFLSNKKDAATDGIETESIFQPESFHRSKQDDNSKKKRPVSMDQFVKSAVPSMKQLKRWKVQRSPMVIIVCISARRAMTILKSLSSLGVRAAKLFAKHMILSEQVSMLSSNSYGIAVGTPNRLLKLVSCEQGDSQKKNGSKPPLCLDSTQLFLVDCHEDNKKFTLCTQNDTAPDLMELIRVAVKPQMARKDPIKLALV